MPDGDIFRRTFARGWRVPAKLASSGAGADIVAPRATNGLVRTLREAGGCPALREIVAEVEGVRREIVGAPLLYRDPVESARLVDRAFAAIDAIESSAERHIHTLLAADAGRDAIVAMTRAVGPPDPDPAAPIGQEIAGVFCTRLVEHYFLHPLRSLLAGNRFATAADARALEREVAQIMAPRVAAIARDLDRDPTGRRVTSPRWPKVPSPTTDEVINTVIIP